MNIIIFGAGKAGQYFAKTMSSGDNDITLIESNPVLDHARLIVFPILGSMTINRPEKYGGDLHFETYEDLVKAYEDGLHPMDLKNGVADSIADILEPAREYLNKHPGNFEALKKIIGQ